ncbi:MAG: HAD family hydrolase [Epsilonproteobacteria bacterium]|nr:HAD family hydrolase [Campylobacterota bacterium]
MLKKSVIFDMDGTLVNSSITLANAINYVREQLYLPRLKNEEILVRVNDHSINPAEYFYKSKHFLPIHEKWFSEYYSAHHGKELELYEGITDMIHELKQRNFKIAVATNAYRKSALESLTHLGIVQHFDSVVCFDDVGLGKPAPDMLFKILDDFGLQKEESVFVGDGERDMMAAKNANMDFIMVNWGFSTHKSAVGSVENLKDLLLKC